MPPHRPPSGLGWRPAEWPPVGLWLWRFSIKVDENPFGVDAENPFLALRTGHGDCCPITLTSGDEPIAFLVYLHSPDIHSLNIAR